MIQNKHMECPDCGADTTFITTAHVMQEWEVTPDGSFIDCVSDCLEVVHEPDPGNIWTCKKCGKDAVLVDNKQQKGA